jgi:RimJ/RimL family protein N-acetyltransferase
MTLPELTTGRLRLRQWRDGDWPELRRMNADPEVMRYFLRTLTDAESRALFEKIKSRMEENGWGMWAAEVLDSGRFIGFVGLNRPDFDAPFVPCVEIGWRLVYWSWGRGYATEAALKCLDFAFRTAGLTEVVSFTAKINLASRRVMEKIGMTRDPADDFDHPSVPPGHPLNPHVLYRVSGPGTRA